MACLLRTEVTPGLPAHGRPMLWGRREAWGVFPVSLAQEMALCNSEIFTYHVCGVTGWWLFETWQMSEVLESVRAEWLVLLLGHLSTLFCIKCIILYICCRQVGFKSAVHLCVREMTFVHTPVQSGSELGLWVKLMWLWIKWWCLWSTLSCKAFVPVLCVPLDNSQTYWQRSQTKEVYTCSMH